jgi:hypothetical protein
LVAHFTGQSLRLKTDCHCSYTQYGLWSYKERWDFSNTEALCTGSLNFPKKPQIFPLYFLKLLTYLCFWAFAFQFQMLVQISSKINLGKQGVKWKLRYWRFQIWKNFALVSTWKVHEIVKTCKKFRKGETFFFFLTKPTFFPEKFYK